MFVTNPLTEEIRLNQLEQWLLNCNYPPKLIKSAFHNAKLQGPAPAPKSQNNVLPFVTTYYSNLNLERTVKVCNDRLQNSTNPRIQEVFENSQAVLSFKQPPNILTQLTRAKFNTIPETPKENGIFKCTDKRCKLCRLYMQECKSFITARGT